MEVSKILQRVITLVVIGLILVLCIKKIKLVEKYPEYTVDDVSRIIVMDNATGDELNIVNPTDIQRIVEELAGAKLEAEGLGIVTPDNSYRLTLYSDKNLEIVGFNPVIIVDNDSIQREPICYHLSGDASIYDDIQELFKATEEKQEK